jgi:hypothetical protein
MVTEFGVPSPPEGGVDAFGLVDGEPCEPLPFGVPFDVVPFAVPFDALGFGEAPPFDPPGCPEPPFVLSLLAPEHAARNAATTTNLLKRESEEVFFMRSLAFKCRTARAPED